MINLFAGNATNSGLFALQQQLLFRRVIFAQSNTFPMQRKDFLKGSAIIGATFMVPQLLKSASGLWDEGTGRRVYRILSASKEMVGTLPILRAFAGDHQDYVSPYVLLDEFGPVALAQHQKPLRVDAHPHAGVIPTTYLLQGSGHHKDSLDYDFQIQQGDFMMFSSGRGAIHMEETGQSLYDEGGTQHGFQIWLNMPAAHKWDAPTTTVHRDQHMGTVLHEVFTAKVVLGELFGIRSSIETLLPAFYYHIKVKPNGKVTLPTDPTHNAFIYAIDGSLELEGRRPLAAHQIALFERGANDINLYSAEGAEFILLGGQPLNEPVFSYGPFVMTNEEEIRRCIRDYQLGKMGDPNRVN
jgi:redox-sensitive bicupin YhaK (pirin superfamily)